MVSRRRTQALVQADKWIAAKASEQGKRATAQSAQDRADAGVRSLLRRGK